MQWDWETCARLPGMHWVEICTVRSGIEWCNNALQQSALCWTAEMPIDNRRIPGPESTQPVVRTENKGTLQPLVSGKWSIFVAYSILLMLIVGFVLD